MLSSTLLEVGKTMTQFMYLEVNFVSLFDSLVNLGDSTYHEFFKISRTITQKRYSTSHNNENLIFNAAI